MLKQYLMREQLASETSRGCHSLLEPYQSQRWCPFLTRISVIFYKPQDRSFRTVRELSKVFSSPYLWRALLKHPSWCPILLSAPCSMIFLFLEVDIFHFQQSQIRQSANSLPSRHPELLDTIYHPLNSWLSSLKWTSNKHKVRGRGPESEKWKPEA